MKEDIHSSSENEIDFLEIFQKVYKKRKFILKIVFVFFLLGLFVALFSPKEYTATTTLVPQISSSNKIGGNLGGLAAMAGINLGTSTSSDEIPPVLYPKIVNSLPFKKELINTPLNFSGIDKPITFQEYYKNHQGNLLQVIKKYTLGLPSVIVSNTKKNNILTEKLDTRLYKISVEENNLFKILESKVLVTLNDKGGYISLSSSMPEPTSAAQLTKKVQELLQKYVIKFKTNKSKDQLDFIEKRYDEAKSQFKKKQSALASYRDRNVGLITSRSQSYLERLQAEYSLSLDVFTELSKQLESQKIKVKENTPVFSIIDPVSIPIEKSKPKRLSIIGFWIFLGILLGVLLVLGRDWINNIKRKNERKGKFE